MLSTLYFQSSFLKKKFMKIYRKNIVLIVANLFDTLQGVGQFLDFGSCGHINEIVTQVDNHSTNKFFIDLKLDIHNIRAELARGLTMVTAKTCFLFEMNYYYVFSKEFTAN